MRDVPKLVVMLTQNDLTVQNAYEIFEKCKDTKAQYWGLKEKPLPVDQMRELYAYMRACGKTTVLEVVAYTEAKSLEGAKIAVDCGCDILMGTMFCDAVRDLCEENKIKYMPFVGGVSGRLSVLSGSVEKMLAYAKRCLDKGVYGFDLLGYRYVGDAPELIKRFISAVSAPVCVTGSVNSYEKLDELKACAPWGFTIGGAFIENKFGEAINAQIDCVCEYFSRPVLKF